MNRTNLTELAEFFPANNTKTRTHARIVPWAKGETIEQAQARADERTARIHAQIAARKAAAAANK